MFKKIKLIVIVVAGSIKLFLPFLFAGEALGSQEKCALKTAIKNLKAQTKDADSMKLKSYYFVRRKALNSPDAEYLSMCGIVDVGNSKVAIAEGNRFVSISYITKNSFETVKTNLDNGNSRAILDSIKNPKSETVFEKTDWNPNCVDASHPPTYTGIKS